uniref:Uncharacterized protein n=1 Tax=Strombidium rassoulzadegani TaxID=1082188 RepID=A0A7S3FXW8_9SPIT|mmetsp:Transcript_9160/g.15425  ORF Transcript_9160/g.15425 Transcript_9160/m.15425 type:complete len:340 (+) Transcript_9160:156-1175(+)
MPELAAPKGRASQQLNLGGSRAHSISNASFNVRTNNNSVLSSKQGEEDDQLSIDKCSRIQDPTIDANAYSEEEEPHARSAALDPNAATTGFSKKSVVGVLFHPYFQNYICVLQENGSVHMIDGTNGVISHENVATGMINSSWAVDPLKVTMFIIGDTGKACLYDMSMGARDQMTVIDQRVASKQRVTAPRVPPSRQSMRSPPRLQRTTESKFLKIGSGSNASRAQDNQRKFSQWTLLKPWFQAHKFKHMDPNYVVSAQHSPHGEVFLSATSHGEVKLWNATSLDFLGTLNSNDLKVFELERTLAFSHTNSLQPPLTSEPTDPSTSGEDKKPKKRVQGRR